MGWWWYGCTHAKPCISSVDEAARKLTLLTTSHGNWAYTCAWFNSDAEHLPLPAEGHLSAMTNGGPSTNACRTSPPTGSMPMTFAVGQPGSVP